MKTIEPSEIFGEIQAPPSKSMMVRAVTAGALAEGETKITNASFCDDGLAAISCAKALGADVAIDKEKGIVGIVGGNKPKARKINCGESGLCMRMLPPICALFEGEFVLNARGSLMKRNVAMMEKPLNELGAKCGTNKGFPPVLVKGKMRGGEVEIDGSESSQFLTGLLMALPLCERDSVVRVQNLKSKPYVKMTLSLLGRFGIEIGGERDCTEFEIMGGQKYKPCEYNVEGDWSGAAFLLVAGAIAGGIAGSRQNAQGKAGSSCEGVSVSGLDLHSPQADKAILDVLKMAGANVKINKKEGSLCVKKSTLSAFSFDATDCPDLFPSLVALACNCKGTSRIKGVGRLRGKESDRAGALVSEFGKIGGNVSVQGNEMIVEGKKLRGGKVDSHNDHRIAMACAVAGLASEKGVSISGGECVAKSYPKFFGDLKALGAKANDKNGEY